MGEMDPAISSFDAIYNGLIEDEEEEDNDGEDEEDDDEDMDEEVEQRDDKKQEEGGQEDDEDEEEGDSSEEDALPDFRSRSAPESGVELEQRAAGLPREMYQGYRVLREMMAGKNHQHNWPFMDPVDSSQRELWDYDSIVKTPIWLRKVRERLLDGEYGSLTALFRDLRLMFRNCYRYNGPTHGVTRRALKLEQIMELGIAQMEPDLRAQCTVEATEGADAVVDDAIVNRRRSTRAKTPRYFSHVLYWVRHERADRDKEYRRQQLEAKREQRGQKEARIEHWERQLLAEPVRDRLRCMWEFPQLVQFLHLSLRALNILEIPLYEMERMLLLPQSSETLSILMTSLVSPPLTRAKLADLPPMPYHVWNAKLAHRAKLWFRAYARERGATDRLLETQGIEPPFWDVVGTKYPFKQRQLHQFSFYQRVWILKAFCDHIFHTHRSVQDCVMETSDLEPRETVVGRDRHGYEYLHFPQLLVRDVRVYRRRPWRAPDAWHAPPAPAAASPPRLLAAGERWTKTKLRQLRRRLRELRRAHRERQVRPAARSYTCLSGGGGGGDSGASGGEEERPPDAGDDDDWQTPRRPAPGRRRGRGRGRRKGRGRGHSAASSASVTPAPPLPATPVKSAPPLLATPVKSAPPADETACQYCGLSIRSQRARNAHRCIQKQAAEAGEAAEVESSPERPGRASSDWSGDDSEQESDAAAGRKQEDSDSEESRPAWEEEDTRMSAGDGEDSRMSGGEDSRMSTLGDESRMSMSNVNEDSLMSDGEDSCSVVAVVAGSGAQCQPGSPAADDVTNSGDVITSVSTAAAERPVPPAADSDDDKPAGLVNGTASLSEVPRPCVDSRDEAGGGSPDGDGDGTLASPAAEAAGETPAGGRPGPGGDGAARNGEAPVKQETEEWSDADVKTSEPAGKTDPVLKWNKDKLDKEVAMDVTETNNAEASPRAIDKDSEKDALDVKIKTEFAKTEPEAMKSESVTATSDAENEVKTEAKFMKRESDVKTESDTGKTDTNGKAGEVTDIANSGPASSAKNCTKAEVDAVKEDPDDVSSDEGTPKPVSLSAENGLPEPEPEPELPLPELVPEPDGLPAPDPEQFLLVADSFESLRRLIDSFSPDATASHKKKSKQPQCEVELHSELKKILEELEPLEAKINNSVRRMRKRLCQEWLSFVKRPSGYRHPGEEQWKEPNSEPAPPPPPPAPAPAAPSTPPPASDEESCDEEGRRRQRSRAVKRKLAPPPPPPTWRQSERAGRAARSAAAPAAAAAAAPQVSSRGRLRKVRKLDDFSYEVDEAPARGRESPVWTDPRERADKAADRAEEGDEEEFVAPESRRGKITEPSAEWNSDLVLVGGARRGAATRTPGRPIRPIRPSPRGRAAGIVFSRAVVGRAVSKTSAANSVTSASSTVTASAAGTPPSVAATTPLRPPSAPLRTSAAAGRGRGTRCFVVRMGDDGKMFMEQVAGGGDLKLLRPATPAPARPDDMDDDDDGIDDGDDPDEPDEPDEPEEDADKPAGAEASGFPQPVQVLPLHPDHADVVSRGRTDTLTTSPLLAATLGRQILPAPVPARSAGRGRGVGRPRLVQHRIAPRPPAGQPRPVTSVRLVQPAGVRTYLRATLPAAGGAPTSVVRAPLPAGTPPAAAVRASVPAATRATAPAPAAAAAKTPPLTPDIAAKVQQVMRQLQSTNVVLTSEKAQQVALRIVAEARKNKGLAVQGAAGRTAPAASVPAAAGSSQIMLATLSSAPTVASGAGMVTAGAPARLAPVSSGAGTSAAGRRIPCYRQVPGGSPRLVAGQPPLVRVIKALPAPRRPAPAPAAADQLQLAMAASGLSDLVPSVAGGAAAAEDGALQTVVFASAAAPLSAGSAAPAASPSGLAGKVSTPLVFVNPPVASTSGVVSSTAAALAPVSDATLPAIIFDDSVSPVASAQPLVNQTVASSQSPAGSQAQSPATPLQTQLAAPSQLTPSATAVPSPATTPVAPKPSAAAPPPSVASHPAGAQSSPAAAKEGKIVMVNRGGEQKLCIRLAGGQLVELSAAQASTVRQEAQKRRKPPSSAAEAS